MLQTENLIEIKNLSFSRNDRIIYQNLNLQIPKGSITAIMGPSGIGKTTLLKLIGGQIIPTSGEIWFENCDLTKVDLKTLYELRKQMGLLFQSGALFNDLSVFDNVAFVLREHTKLPESLIRKIVLAKLEAVGLRGAKDLMPFDLSGGMARRVALVRAIALDPKLIMYDEPFAGQDPINMSVIVALIKKLNQTLGLTSIVVSHDVSEVLSIADFVYIIANQKVIAKGTPSNLVNNPDPKVQQFLNGYTSGSVEFHYPASDYLQELIYD